MIKRLFLKYIILFVLMVIGSSTGVQGGNSCFGTDTCSDVLNAWFNANMTYTSAFQSYFYGSPTSCGYECQNAANVPQCIEDCQLRRRNALAGAEMNLFSKALQTCTPITIDQCAAASAMAEQCMLDHDYLSYTDPEIRLAVYSQYSACRLASKVDLCQ
ncbi:MAG: hypothetical protein KF736_11360 [Acidobacteria bacterium]|nr:hypothetical protein [Acidobacteriota bacterium]MCW5949999.1 hypothetical protein [Pyrinomonadaceae bacterium]